MWMLQTQGMHRKFEKVWSEWLDSILEGSQARREEHCEEADKKQAATATAADGDDDVAVMDDTEWQTVRSRSGSVN